MKLKKTKYAIKCPKCKGEGHHIEKILYYLEEWNDPKDFPAMKVVKIFCEACNGKGTLPVFEEEGK